MSLSFESASQFEWVVRKIAVIGPGIVGMPMAAMLANARICEGTDQPAEVVVVQRASQTSGWKVEAINRGQSVIGGIEPDLDEIVAGAYANRLLSATHDYQDIADADLILVSVQTDRDGFGPDYGPLMQSLDALCLALVKRPAGNIPLVVFESTLAPSSMDTVVREKFAAHGLIEGRDVLLGNSPNRVMPGRLVERVAQSDKLIAGLHPLTPVLIERVYRRIVTKANLFKTNSMTAEFVKTLENAYRDVRIAFSAELVRSCDSQDVDFYALREQVNRALSQSDNASGCATAVPSGAILIPGIGVGGHCLPKDGVLLWWRKHQSGADTSHSEILNARHINDASPAASIAHAQQRFGALFGRRVALLGTAYRFDSEDTRNSPTLSLARQLITLGAEVTLHDPYVKPDDQNLKKTQLSDCFTNSLKQAVENADVVFYCVGHAVYLSGLDEMLAMANHLEAIYDGANLFQSAHFDGMSIDYAGIGRGTLAPPEQLVQETVGRFRQMEQKVSRELVDLIRFLNDHYAGDEFNQVSFETVRHLAGSCVTGCAIAPVLPGDSQQAHKMTPQPA
ncbi:MAG: nucleotide sugar dehydrogenase [Burkholderiaceae bacterium]